MSFFTLFGWFIALFWLWHGGVVIHFLHRQQLNKRVAHLPPLTQYPKVSIIVPARDEQQAIRATLTSLLALDYPHFEVLAIDDRSRDATGAIMDELQAHSPRLKVIHVAALPEGWLGKNHAMHLAAQQAVGDYLLFTDGDVIYAAETLKQAMQVVMAQHWDHFALMPRLLPGDYAENSVLQFMGLAFIIGTYPFLVANPNSRCFAGVGSFNLIRRGCYWHIGGFENLRLEVVEDMALGREVKRQGFRSQLLFAEHLLQVRWQQKVSGLVHGIEKNSFAAIDYSLTNLFALTVVFKTFFFLPYVAVFVLPMPVALGYGVALVLLHSLLAYMGARAKVGWQISVALPFSAAVTLWAVWRSAFLTLKQGGIYWRDTFYPLTLLKSKIPPASL